MRRRPSDAMTSGQRNRPLCMPPPPPASPWWPTRRLGAGRGARPPAMKVSRWGSQISVVSRLMLGCPPPAPPAASHLGPHSGSVRAQRSLVISLLAPLPACTCCPECLQVRWRPLQLALAAAAMSALACACVCPRCQTMPETADMSRRISNCHHLQRDKRQGLAPRCRGTQSKSPPLLLLLSDP